MKKIMFSGLPADVSETGLRQALERFGPVGKVAIIRDGDPQQPIAIVEMHITDQAAFDLTTRITDIWHDGRRINTWVLLH